MKLLIQILILMFAPLTSYGADPATVAIGEITAFKKSLNFTLSDVSEFKEIDEFLKTLSTETNKALIGIKEIRWVESTGPRRFRRLEATINEYISDVRSRLTLLSDSNKSRLRKKELLDIAIEKLNAFEKNVSQSVKAAFDYEMEIKRRKKQPTPADEKPPREEEHIEGDTLWGR